MNLRYGSYSKKGFRGSGMRLHHSEYFKYIYQGKEYFYKKKFYVSAYDGTIEYEKITSATFKKAVKRGNKTEIMFVDTDFKDIFFGTVAEILAEHYTIELKYAREALESTLDSIEDFEQKCGNLKETFKGVLFRNSIDDYVKYIIPVKRKREVI